MSSTRRTTIRPVAAAVLVGGSSWLILSWLFPSRADLERRDREWRSGRDRTEQRLRKAGPSAWRAAIGPDEVRAGIRSRLAAPARSACREDPSMRAAARGSDDRVRVGSSRRLDPGSELGDAGYVIRLRHADGRTEELSLGLQHLRPYVLWSSGGFVGNDSIAIEATRNEIDDQSVTMPPLWTKTRGPEYDTVLRCSLAELRRDADGDGLTDIEEDRLVSDPLRADTDGDGMPDGVDPSPLGRAPPRTPGDELWLAAYRAAIGLAGIDRDLLIAPVGGSRPAVPAIGPRVVTLLPDELRAYEAKFGRRVVFEVLILWRGPSRAAVEASFSWRGYHWEAHRNVDGSWSLDLVSSWVT